MRAAFVAATAVGSTDFRLVHFSIQTNHLHLIVEAQDRDALAGGVKGVEVRIARRLNALLARKGTVFADRYHARALTTPRQTRNCLAYVLLNSSRHARAAARVLDPLSSGAYFDGWLSPPPAAVRQRSGPPPVEPPRSWLLTAGWTKWGKLSTSEVPAA